MVITENRRIALNVVATYGRSLFTLVCGLVTGRWALMALGDVDYGLFGVVGGLTAFITFLSGTLSTAVSRFYAFSVGQARVAEWAAEGIENCRRWFNVALLLHMVVPLGLMAVGVPLGEYAIAHNWLVIPAARVEACLWVFRTVCVSCFIGMALVPFSAMYGAKQYIAELTVYSVVTTGLNVCVLYYMVTHPGVWLVRYAVWVMFVSVGPQIIVAIRAVFVFPECRLRWRYMWDPARMKELFLFALHRLGGAIAIMLQNQGIVLVVNRLLGPKQNTSIAMANAVAAHAQTLSGALDGALSPAIANGYGANNYARMSILAMTSCKYSSVLVAIFAIPLSVEIHEIVRLWLKVPPVELPEVCVFLLATLILEKLSAGHFMAIFATGRIGAYQGAISLCGFLALPIAFAMLKFGIGLWGVGLALLLSKGVAVLIRLYYGARIANLSVRVWCLQILFPFVVISGVTVGAAVVPRLVMPPSFIRICLTTLVAGGVFLPLVWFFLMQVEDRAFILVRLKRVGYKVMQWF